MHVVSSQCLKMLFFSVWAIRRLQDSHNSACLYPLNHGMHLTICSNVCNWGIGLFSNDNNNYYFYFSCIMWHHYANVRGKCEFVGWRIGLYFLGSGLMSILEWKSCYLVWLMSHCWCIHIPYKSYPAAIIASNIFQTYNLWFSSPFWEQLTLLLPSLFFSFFADVACEHLIGTVYLCGCLQLQLDTVISEWSNGGGRPFCWSQHL